jgi:Lysozyme inhibitor LprI
MRLALALLFGFALPARADVDFRQEEQARTDIALLTSCVNMADTQEAMRGCVDVTYLACTGRIIGNLSHVAQASCNRREKDFWLYLLDIETRKLEAWSLLKDNQIVQTGVERPSVHEQVLREQDAWETFLNAQCAFDVERFAGGTAGMTEQEHCAMRQIADRLFELRPFMSTYANGISP